MFSLSPGECRGLDPCRGQADGIRGNSWPEPVPCGRELTFPGLREGAAPHSPVTFQVGLFPEPRCLLMSWGERLSALYPPLWAPHYHGPKRLALGQQALASGPCPVPARPVGATGIPLPTRCMSVSSETLTNVTGLPFLLGPRHPRSPWCSIPLRGGL